MFVTLKRVAYQLKPPRNFGAVVHVQKMKEETVLSIDLNEKIIVWCWLLTTDIRKNWNSEQNIYAHKK